MDEVVGIMTKLSEFFSPYLEPVEYSLSMYISHCWIMLGHFNTI